MFVLLLLNIVCTFFAYTKEGKDLKKSIWILFLFLALRYNFGNDYEAYATGFTWSFSDLIDADVEIGYAFLVNLFHPLGFQAMVAFLSGFFCWTLYKTLVRYIPANMYWLVMFSIISNADLIFIGASAIRQTVAMSFIFLAIPCLQKKQLVRYCVLIGLASSFHLSALFFFLLYPLMLVDLSKKSMVWIIGIGAILLATVLKFVVYNYIGDFTESNLEKYAERYGRGAGEAIEGGIVGLAIRAFLGFNLLNSMIHSKDRLYNIFVVISILSFVIFSMREQVMLQRYTLYFCYFFCLTIPHILQNAKDKCLLGGAGYLSLYVVIILWNISMAITFFMTAAPEFFTYRTIFSM